MTLPRHLSYEDIAQTDPFMIEVIDFLSSLVGKQELFLVGGYLRDFMLGNPARDADFVSSRDPRWLAGETATRFGGKCFIIKEGQDIHRVTLHFEDRVYTLDFSPIKGKPGGRPLLAGLHHQRHGHGHLELRPAEGSHPASRPYRQALRLAGPLPSRVEGVPQGIVPLRPGAGAAGHALPAPAGHGSGGAHPQSYEEVRQPALPCTGRKGRRRTAGDLSGPGTSAIFEYLQDNAILYYLFPALAPLAGVPQNYYHHLDVWKHTLLTLNELDRLIERPDEKYPRHALMIREHLRRPLMYSYSRAAVLRLAALFHDTGKAATTQRDETGRIHFHGHAEHSVEEVERAAGYLRLSRRASGSLSSVTGSHMRIASSLAGGPTHKGVVRLARDLGEETVDVVLLSTADRFATLGEASTPEGLQAFVGLCTELLEQRETDEEVKPLINGGDLLVHLDMRPGERVGSLLRQVREAQLEGKVANKEEALEWAKVTLEGGSNGH